MAADQVIGLAVEVQLAQLRAQMGQIPGIAGAAGKGAAAELNRSLKGVEAAVRAANKGATSSADAVTKASGRAKAGLVNLGNQLSDVASQLSTGTSPFTILVQQGPQVAGALDLMGVSMVKVAVAGGVAVAGAVALYEAYRILTRETERETATRELAHSIAQSMVATERKLTAEKIALKVATGEYTKAEGDAANAREAARQGVLDYAEAHLTVKTELMASLEAGRKWIDLQRGISAAAGAWLATLQKIAHPGGDWNEFFKKATIDTNNVLDAFTGLESGSADLQGRLGMLAKAEYDESQKLKELRKVTVEVAQAKGEATKATDEETDAERRLEAAIVAQYEAARRANDLLAQSGEFRLSAEEKIRAELEKTSQAYFDAGVEARFSMEKVAAGEVQLAQDAADKIQAIRDAAAKEAADKAAAEQAKADELARARVQSVLSGISDLASGIAGAMEGAYSHAADNVQRLTEQLAAGDEWYTDAQKRSLQKRIQASEQAARRAFEVEKAAKLASAVVNTASAVVSALANPPGPPFSIPQAVAAGAQGAIQVGVIASEQPAFHSGLAPDEAWGPPSRMLKREGAGILTPQGISALGGPDAVRNANAGASSGGPTTIMAYTVFKNDRQARAVKADAIRQGDPYTDAISRSSKTPAWRRSA